MKKTTLVFGLTLCLILSVAMVLNAGWWVYTVTEPASGTSDYCSSQTWNTLSDFRLDFDHTTDNKTACLSSGTEIGTLSTGATIETPTLTSPGSGGSAILANANEEYIIFDNSSTYFQSKWGRLFFKVKIAGDNTGLDDIVDITETANQDRLRVYIDTNGLLYIVWEDNDGGGIGFNVGNGGDIYDFDNHYGDWAQIELKWDTTRCTEGDGNCGDTGEDEICARIRFDDNQDGDFDDGGSEDWSNWYCETSSTDLEEWASEPSANDFKFGLVSSTYSQDIYIDDIEISSSQPIW